MEREYRGGRQVCVVMRYCIEKMRLSIISGDLKIGEGLAGWRYVKLGCCFWIDLNGEAPIVRPGTVQLLLQSLVRRQGGGLATPYGYRNLI